MTDFPTIDDAARLDRLRAPPRDAPVVVDTDAYNEVDDQFAVVDALCSPLDVQALYAAPFDNRRADGPADGMERSFAELERLLDRVDPQPSAGPFRGAQSYLAAPDDPVSSPAVTDLIDRARSDRDGPLYVVAIGAATNVASALLAAPDLVEEVVVIWLGGQPHDWSSAHEFNLDQDPPAARVLFDSGVPLVHVPCRHVAELVRTSVPELERHLAGRGEVADYLVDTVAEYAADRTWWSKEIWDLAASAWLTVPDAVSTHATHSPILTEDRTWSRDPDRHLIRVVDDVDRDAVFRGFAERIDRVA